jgi:hypothetical protein
MTLTLMGGDVPNARSRCRNGHRRRLEPLNVEQRKARGRIPPHEPRGQLLAVETPHVQRVVTAQHAHHREHATG